MTNNYSTFDIEDFASDDAFKNWVLSPNSNTNFFWENYLQQNPGQTPTIVAAKQLVLDLRESQRNAIDKSTADIIWKNVQHRLVEQPKVFIVNPVILRVAASIALIITCWVGYRFITNQAVQKIQSSNKIPQTQEIEEVNHSENIMRVQLSDGSSVSLEKNSRLRYSPDFNQKIRIVHLQGEAFFEITKNPEKPFLVFANEIVTKVLGTSFRVKAYDTDKNVTVSVRTGRVTVFSRREFDLIKEKQNQTLTGLVLTPNQEAIYVREDERLNKTLVENPILLTTSQKKYDFTFENTPISQVFNLLENAYGVDIVFDEEVFKNCSLTVGLEDEELFDKLKIICKTIGASYQVIDSQIVINGRGC